MNADPVRGLCGELSGAARRTYRIRIRIVCILHDFWMVRQVRLEDGGKYLCWINNTAGEETIKVTLTVTGKLSSLVCIGHRVTLKRTRFSFARVPSAPLTAHLQPQVQTVDVDKDAQFQCIVSGHPVHEVTWLHDGKPILRDSRIEVMTKIPQICVLLLYKLEVLYNAFSFRVSEFLSFKICITCVLLTKFVVGYLYLFSVYIFSGK